MFVSSASSSSSVVLPGQFSTVGRSGSAHHTRNTMDKEETNSKDQRNHLSTGRRIRAPKGEGMSSLMASLTSRCVSSSSDISQLPRLDTTSSLNSDTSCNSSTSYHTLSASSSSCCCCQVSSVINYYITKGQTKMRTDTDNDKQRGQPTDRFVPFLPFSHCKSILLFFFSVSESTYFLHGPPPSVGTSISILLRLLCLFLPFLRLSL